MAKEALEKVRNAESEAAEIIAKEWERTLQEIDV